MNTAVYEVVDPMEDHEGKSQEVKTPPVGEEFSLSKCEAYDPVAASKDPLRGDETSTFIAVHK